MTLWIVNGAKEQAHVLGAARHGIRGSLENRASSSCALDLDRGRSYNPYTEIEMGGRRANAPAPA